MSFLFDIRLTSLQDIIYQDATAGEANMSEVRSSRSGDGLPLLSSLISNINSKQTAKRALFSNVPLEIAPGLRISVKGYNVVHRQTPARTCYVWLEGEKPQLAVGETTRIAEDSARTVDKQEMRKAYKFGGEYVYFTPEEQKQLRDFGSPIIRIIGFKSRSALPAWASVKKSTFLFPSEEDYVGSTRVYTSLWKKLLRDNKMGLAWCITRTNAQPILAAVLPSREQAEEVGEAGGAGGSKHNAPHLPSGLWLYPLPFVDDLRESKAPEGQVRSSDELKNQMRVVVQQLQLPKAVYNPLKYPNPALQWHYRILQALALEEEVPDKVDDATLPKFKAISKRAGGYLEDWSATLRDEASSSRHARASKREPEDDAASLSIPERPSKKSRGATDHAKGAMAGGLSLPQLKSAVQSGGISKMTVAELKDVLASKGLSTAGKKAELVERVEQWVEEA